MTTQIGSEREQAFEAWINERGASSYRSTLRPAWEKGYNAALVSPTISALADALAEALVLVGELANRAGHGPTNTKLEQLRATVGALPGRAGRHMSTFTVSIEIARVTGDDAPLDIVYQPARFVPVWRRVDDVVVDTGASYSAIPAGVLRELGIVPHARIAFALADGRTVESDVGRAFFRINGVEEISRVIFGLPGEPALLGAHTLESLLLGVDPHRERLIPVAGLRY